MKRIELCFKKGEKPKVKGKTFGISREDNKCFSFINNKNDTPGPGMYDPPSQLIRSFKIGNRSKPLYITSNLAQSVGPGVYNLNQQPLSKHKNPLFFQFSKGTAERFKLTKAQIQTPGPCNYQVWKNLNQLSKYQSSPNFRLSQTIRHDQSKLGGWSPGPGSYSFKSSFGNIQTSAKLKRFA